MSINETAMVILEDENGLKFRATLAQANALAKLEQTRKGGIATVTGYKPTTNYVTPPTLNLQVITRFSTKALYERRSLALDALTYNDVLPFLLEDEVLAKELADNKMALISVYNTRKATEIESHMKTLNNDRDDNYRAAHDLCYATMFQGVRVHFLTEKTPEGTRPILSRDGLPTADSIMMSILELNRTVVTEGVAKVVKSGIPVRVSKAIAKALNKRSVSYRALSLKAGNFDSIRVDGQTLTESDVARFGDYLID
jgi:hypothetical protein